MDKLNKIEKITCKFAAVYGIVILSVSMIFFRYFLKNKEIAEKISSLVFCMVVSGSVIFLALCSIAIFILIKNGVHNIKKCDDELFEEIDRYTRCWGESNFHYIRMNQIINYKYEVSGEVDALVNEKEMKRLYGRMDFLRKQNLIFGEISTCMSALIISVVASILINSIDEKNFIYQFLIMCVMSGSFFAAILLRYMSRGEFASFKHGVNEHEMELLQKKIDTAERSLTITEQDENMLHTQQTVIELLIKKRRKSKRKKEQKELENSLEAIDKLNLCIHDYSDSYIREINIDGQTGYLVYDLEKGKENNYIGELNLKTQEFSKLYKILDQYKWISYPETTDYKIK